MVVVAFVLSTGLTACKSDNPTVKSGAGSTSSSAGPGGAGSSTSSSPAPTADCPATTLDKTAPARQPRAEMTGVRAEHAGHFDRVTFEFQGTSPGYRVAYIDKPVHEDGSGAEVAVAGDAVIEVHMDNASGYHFEGDKSGPTYTGPSRLSPAGTTQVQELVRSGDFEGVLSWVVGVRSKVGFRVSRLDAPPRLVIDICA